MERYRAFLKNVTKVCLALLLGLSALAGVLTHPTVSFFGGGFAEGETVTTLSVMLAGFCLARLFLGLWEKDLSLRLGLLLGLGALTALLVLPIREWLPFTLDGYVFPLLTGLAVPRLVLTLLPEGKNRRIDGVLFWISGGLLLLLCLMGLYGVLFASRITELILCRALSLPLLWLAPLFDFYAGRKDFGGRLLSAALWILPLFPVLGILWERVFALFPLGVLLVLSAPLAGRLVKRAPPP